MDELDGDSVTSNTPTDKKCCPYEAWTVVVLRICYGIMLLVWLVLIVWFKLYRLEASWLLWIPVGVFLVAMWNAPFLTYEVESEMSKVVYFPMIIVVGLALFSWMSKDYSGNGAIFGTGVLIAMVLVMISLLDVWTERRWVSVYKHGKSMLQTMSITIMITLVVSFGIASTGPHLP